MQTDRGRRRGLKIYRFWFCPPEDPVDETGYPASQSRRHTMRDGGHYDLTAKGENWSAKRPCCKQQGNDAIEIPQPFTLRL